MPAVLTQKQIDQIAERWSSSAWDAHEKAFARQWMVQAQDDIALLVADLRAAREGALKLHSAVFKTVAAMAANMGSNPTPEDRAKLEDLRSARDGAKDLYDAITRTVAEIEGDANSHVGTEL